MLCTCGKHDLGEGPFETCNTCGGMTRDEPKLVWIGGEPFVIMPLCHTCVEETSANMIDTAVPAHLVPPDIVERAATVAPFLN